MLASLGSVRRWPLDCPAGRITFMAPKTEVFSCTSGDSSSQHARKHIHQLGSVTDGGIQDVSKRLHIAADHLARFLPRAKKDSSKSARLAWFFKASSVSCAALCSCTTAATASLPRAEVPEVSS